MKNQEKENKVPGSGVQREQEFKGYTMDELRYQRALVALKKEFLREKAIKQTKEIKEQVPLLNGKAPSIGGGSRGIMGKLIKGLSFTDYILLGFQMLKIGKKIGSIFGKKQ